MRLFARVLRQLASNLLRNTKCFRRATEQACIDNTHSHTHTHIPAAAASGQGYMWLLLLLSFDWFGFGRLRHGMVCAVCDGMVALVALGFCLSRHAGRA